MTVADLYAKIEGQLTLQLPFVVYRKENESLLNVFLQNNDTLYETSDYSISGFVFAPFDTDKKAILIPSEDSVFYSIVLPDGSKELKIKTIDSFDNKPNSTDIQNSHKDLVAKGITEINSGVFQKVVLSRKEEVVVPKLDVLKTFKRLINTYPNAFVYCWYHPKIGTWLGATPETLLRIKANQFSTMALAGTQLFQKDKKAIWGTKEIKEQQIVTDFIVKELSSIADQVNKSEVYTYRAGSLLHLCTDISCTLRVNTSVITKVIGLLHPTPAVCGLPKEVAKSFIIKEEGYDRKFYTGFLGELNTKQDVTDSSHLYVNLRCMEIENEKIMVYVGGGITADSDPESEWNETVRKAEIMKKVL